MPNSPDQVSAFEKQIEGSIDLQIHQLQELDTQKSKALSSLKSSILESIKQDRKDNPSTPEKEGKYSADLRLTGDELKQVFEEVKKGNEQMFSENGLESFWEFRSFIGFDSDEIAFAHTLQEVTLFGKKIELALPLGTNDLIAGNFSAAIRQIEKRKDLEPFIPERTKLIPRGGLRLEFVVQKDGKEVQYSATPERVLRLDQAPPSQKIQEWTQTALHRGNLERQLREALQGDKTLGNEQRIAMMSMGTHKIVDGTGEALKIPEKYQTIIDQIKALRKQERSLGEQCSVRMLFDETSGRVVREKGDPRYTDSFEYEYLAQDGSTETKIRHYSNRKDSVTEYFPNSEQAQKSTTFHENGNVRVTSEYQSDGAQLSDSSYRQDGTLKTKRERRNEDVYDESGANVVYRIMRLDDGIWKKVMIAANGENFGSFEYEKSKNPSLTEAQYLEKFQASIQTSEQYFVFEETFMRELKLSEGVLRQIRQKGREITGLVAKEESLESRYGIQIETEEWSQDRIQNYIVQNTRLPMRTLDLEITALSSALEKYPSVFIKNSGLKTVYIFGNWKSVNSDIGRTSAGGFSFGNGEIAISIVKYAFDHELFHCIDWTYGAMSDDDAEWGRRAHGDDYMSIYGKSGHDAIKTGKGHRARPEGHASAYGKYGGIDEDQAEMANALMENNDAVLRYIASEPSLAEKARMIQEMYYALSDGKMDQKFWEDVRAGKKIDATYWASRDIAQDFVSTPVLEAVRREFVLLSQISENIKLQNWDKVHKDIASLISSNPEKISNYHSRISSELEAALRNAGKGKSEAMLIEFSQKYPDRPEYHASLGELYRSGDLQDEAKAFQNFRLAIEKGSTSQEPYMEVANHYKEEGQFGEQIKTFELALVKVPSYSLPSVIYLYLAEAYLATGNTEKAIETYESALGKDNRVVEPLAYLYYSHQNDPDKARQLYFGDEAQKIKDDPNNPEHQKNWHNFIVYSLMKHLNKILHHLMQSTKREAVINLLG